MPVRIHRFVRAVGNHIRSVSGRGVRGCGRSKRIMTMLRTVDGTTQNILDLLHRGGRFRYSFTLPERKSLWQGVEHPFRVPDIDHNIYFGVHPCLVEKSPHQRCTNDDICAINCLYAEFDPDPMTKEELADHIELLELQPTLLVDSGRGYHGYWLLRDTYCLDSIDARERVTRLQKAFVGAVGGDPAAKDLARMLRVPGTHNYKDIFAPDYPLVSIVHYDSVRLYDIDDLERFVDIPAIDDASGILAFPSRSPYGAAALSSEAASIAITPEGSRNDQLNRSAYNLGTLVAAGAVDEAEVVDTLTERALESGLDKEEVGKTIGSGLKAGKQNPRVIQTPLSLEVSAGWPAPPDEAAYHGLVGDFVRIVSPHTESDPVALLTQALLHLGNIMGRHAYFRVETDQHFANEFAVLVGRSSKSRKGTSAGHVRHLCREIDPDWVEHRIRTGLSTGEGLIYHVRDAEEACEDKYTDPGVVDKRLLAEEAEFASVLKVGSREGNTLSPIIRLAFDGRPLETLTRNNPIRATDTHISIIGHSVKEEITRYLTEVEYANGFANRFLWVAVKRSQLLPFGGNMDVRELEPIFSSLRAAAAYGGQDRELRRDPEADEYWASIYPELAADKTGLLGAITGRAEAHTMRLALIYALLDKCPDIKYGHLHAAHCLWQYSDRSAAYIFGSDTIGNSTADRILKNLMKTSDGMTLTEISQIFHNHVAKEELGHAVSLLVQQGRAVREKVTTVGRTKNVCKAL